MAISHYSRPVTFTYRQRLEHAVAQIAYASIGGSPWTDDFEAAQQELYHAIAKTIDGNPELSDVFNRIDEA